MYLSSKASRVRQREAQKARDNRAEIVKALSLGQITKRDLFKWGILTTTGLLACKNGLSPFARSAFADVPTGTPRSPLFNAAKFSQRMPRLRLQTPMPLTRNANDEAVFPVGSGHPNAKRLSYHEDFNNYNGPPPNPFRNPITNRGPMEGRPPGEFFAHQRWVEFSPRSATSCHGDNACPAPGSTRISSPRTRTACGAMAPAGLRKAACHRF
jgi:hypothetical protein